MEQGNITPVDLQRHLGGMSYPASKQELHDFAEEKGAGKEVLDFMEMLPDQDYESPTDVSKAAGNIM